MEGPAPRAETGPMQFGDDWSGAFIRGDNAFHYAIELRAVLKTLGEDQQVQRMVLEGLASTLESSHAQCKDPPRQVLRPFSQCLPPPKEDEPLTEQAVASFAERHGFTFRARTDEERGLNRKARTDEEWQRERPDMLWVSTGRHGQVVWNMTLESALGYLQMEAGK